MNKITISPSFPSSFCSFSRFTLPFALSLASPVAPAHSIPFFDQFKMSDFCSITVKRSDKNVGFFLLDFLEKTSDFKFSVW